jgi:tRNA (guanine-N7-)-methyltransferase
MTTTSDRGSDAPPSSRKRRVRASGRPPEAGSAPFFGRRKGKKLRAFQTGLMTDLLPLVRLELTTPVTRPDHDLWLEIGFGGGEHLIAGAAAHRDADFIGCEPFVNGFAKALAALATANLDNLRLHNGEAQEVIAALPDGCLAGVYLLYPDPWPKRRHRKRRFVSDEMLDALARTLRPGAELRFATDIDDYAGWTLARILRNGHFDWCAKSARDWRTPWAGWSGTRYEEKALREGRAPAYLTFVRR